jgi:pimeloyl-ACP methyl ester carboxylesterase
VAIAHADVNGQRLGYEDSGGRRPAVLFSHGIFMDRTMFDPQVAALAPDLRCIRWDQRGHGATGRASAPFTYWDSAEDAVGLLDHLEVDRAVFVGMSQGGFISLRAALRHPERVPALVLIDSQAGSEDPQVLTGYRAAAEIGEAHGLVDEVAQMAATIIIGQDSAIAAHWIARWREAPPGPLPLLIDVLGAREDITARLREIACPALVIHGEDDAAIPMELAQRLARGLPGCERLLPIPGAGHASNLTHPQPVNTALRDFLVRHAAR